MSNKLNSELTNRVVSSRKILLFHPPKEKCENDALHGNVNMEASPKTFDEKIFKRDKIIRFSLLYYSLELIPIVSFFHNSHNSWNGNLSKNNFMRIDIETF